MKYVITLFCLFGSFAFGSSFDRCGKWMAEGKISKVSSDYITFVLSEGAESEVALKLKNTRKLSKGNIGINAEIVFTNEKKCQFSCEGEFLKLVRKLKPHEKPKDFFFPSKGPITTLKCK